MFTPISEANGELGLHPSQSMTRTRWGAALWILCVLTYPAQFLAATQWPQAYEWRSNTISDLGVTSCATFDAGTRVERYIRSPANILANGGTVLNGLLLAAGAVLLWSAWPRRRTGRCSVSFDTLTLLERGPRIDPAVG